jgi:hypothetical protein
LQPPTLGRSHQVFNKLKYGGGKLICAKDKVLLPLKEYTDTLFIPVVITGFEADKVLPVEQVSAIRIQQLQFDLKIIFLLYRLLILGLAKFYINAYQKICMGQKDLAVSLRKCCITIPSSR